MRLGKLALRLTARGRERGEHLTFAGIPTFIGGHSDLFGDDFLVPTATASARIGNALPALPEQFAWTLFEIGEPGGNFA